jgi:two-component system NarL family response regulator
MEIVRLLLVDDHQIIREALKSLLEKVREFIVVGEAGNALELHDLVRLTTPHIVCMDIGMPGINGIEATRQLVLAYPSIKVIALSSHSDRRYVMDMMDAGASAYIIKTEAANQLMLAINAVREGRKYLCPLVMETVLDVASHQTQQDQNNRLTKRECQVLELVSQGLTSVEIGKQMFISSSTVEVHRRNIMSKLNLHSIAELTRYALSNFV